MNQSVEPSNRSLEQNTATKPKTKGQLLSDLLKQLYDLMSAKNQNDGKNFKEWYSVWIVKTLSWRAPELMYMNLDDIEDRIKLICEQKEYYNEVISLFNSNKKTLLPRFQNGERKVPK